MTTIGKRLADAAASATETAFSEVVESLKRQLSTLTKSLLKRDVIVTFPYSIYAEVAATFQEHQIVQLSEKLDAWLASEDVKCHISHYRYESDDADYWQLTFSITI